MIIIKYTFYESNIFIINMLLVGDFIFITFRHEYLAGNFRNVWESPMTDWIKKWVGDYF